MKNKIQRLLFLSGYKQNKQDLNEADYSIHLDRDDSGIDLIDNPKPYGGGTDSIYMMRGRDTGHFGSGTYLSTYRDVDNDTYNQLKNYHTTDDKPIVKLDNGTYLMDLDRFDLYKPETREHAELLFNTLRKINSAFFTYLSNGMSSDVKKMLVDINDNLKVLDLKIPDGFFKEAIKLAQKMGSNYIHNYNPEFKASLSTIFMEKNGWNGVNVNGIEGFDNTLHGSVIYHLNKVVDKSKETKNKSSWDIFTNKQNSWDKIIKTANECIHCISFANLSIPQINYLLKNLNGIIDIGNIKYLLDDNSDKITKEQYDYIYKQYPKIALQKLKDNPKLKIPDGSFYYLMKNGYRPEPTSDNLWKMSSLMHTYYSNDVENANIAKNYLQTVNYNDLGDYAKEDYDELVKDINRNL